MGNQLQKNVFQANNTDRLLAVVNHKQSVHFMLCQLLNDRLVGVIGMNIDGDARSLWTSFFSQLSQEVLDSLIQAPEHAGIRVNGLQVAQSNGASKVALVVNNCQTSYILSKNKQLCQQEVLQAKATGTLHTLFVINLNASTANSDSSTVTTSVLLQTKETGLSFIGPMLFRLSANKAMS